MFDCEIISSVVSGMNSLSKIILTDKVTSIGERAFYGCTSLTSINIPNSVTVIGSSAFSGCTGLTSINIPNSVTSIGERAFSGCTGLTSITLGNSVTSISDGAFYGCSMLTSVHISDIASWCNIEFLPQNHPFQYSNEGHLYLKGEEIKKLIIPNSVTSIGNYAFYNCSGLTSVTIPSSVTSIGICAFRGCSGITSITIPNSVTSIGLYAFYNCSGLTSVTIPSSVTSIGSCAFQGCSGITSITIPNSVTSIGWSAFYGCTGLTSITLGNSVTVIGSSAFEGCTGLTSINIPNSVTSIGSSAFTKCNELKTIWMGNNIQSIGSGAFSYCPKIEDIYCSTVRYPKTEKDIFKESYPDYITLHVPAESVKQYKAVEPWSKFRDVVALTDDDYPSGGEGTETCIKPTIIYQNGKLKFSSATQGSEFVYEITDSDIKKDYGAEVQLSATYHISVYATKNGYQNSDVATATLCWIDQQPRTEGITNGIAQVPANAVLIQSSDGILTIQGTDDGTPIAVYTLNGQQAGSAISQNGQATIGTTLQPGSVAIVKIGQKSVKVVVK